MDLWATLILSPWQLEAWSLLEQSACSLGEKFAWREVRLERGSPREKFALVVQLFASSPREKFVAPSPGGWSSPIRPTSRIILLHQFARSAIPLWPTVLVSLVGDRTAQQISRAFLIPLWPTVLVSLVGDRTARQIGQAFMIPL